MGSVFRDLLVGARAGGEWAWVRLYDDHCPRLLAYARSRGAPEPEDLVGEVFVQVVRDIGSFHGGESDFRRWIYTIARNRLIDDHRRRLRRPFDLMEPMAISAIGPTGNVELDALDSIGDSEVLRLLGHLTPDQRDVLALRMIADLTLADTAEVMGRTAGAIKALQRRALDRLGEILESSVTFSGDGTL